MRNALLLIVGFLVVALFPFDGAAKGVKLTKKPSRNRLRQGASVTRKCDGIQKTCRANKEHVCEYGCVQGEGCEGDCTTCGDKRSVVFPGFYSNRMVRQSVRQAR
jgi:hypothetical protein